MATINNSKKSTLISGSSGTDSIFNGAAFVTIKTGAGNDTIRNSGGSSQAATYCVIDAGDGNDSIYNFDWGDSSTILGGAGNDTIFNRAADSTLDGGAGNDSIRNITDGVSINGGAGNDTLFDDRWVSGNSYNTLVGGAGNDIISLSNNNAKNVIAYASGDGNDTVCGIKSDDTINITNGAYSTTKSGSDVIINVGSGSMLLKGAASTTLRIIGTYSNEVSGVTLSNSNSNTVINGTSAADSISNGSSNVTINTGDGDDSVYNYASTVSVDLGNGNDSIYNSGYVSTICAGAGDDTVKNYGTGVSVDLGDGNDSIYNSGSNISINTGAGNDTVRLSSSFHMPSTVRHESGNDIITNMITSDLLQLPGQTIGKTSVIGDDLLVTVGNDKLTLLGAGNHAIRAQVGNGNIVTLNADKPARIHNNASIAMIVTGDGDDTVGNYGNTVSVDSGDGNDSIYNDGKHSTVRAGKGDDTVEFSPLIYVSGYNPVYLVGGGGSDSLIGSLTGGDSSVASGGGSGYTPRSGYIYTYNVFEYAPGDGNDIITGFNSSDSIRILDNAQYSTLTEGSDVIVSLEGGNIRIKKYSAAPHIIGGTFVIDNSDFDASITGTDNADLVYNRGGRTSIRTGAGDDSVSNYSAGEVSIAAEAGNDFIYNSGETVTVRAGEGNDTVENRGGGALLDMGEGNDSVLNYNACYSKVRGGDGNDVIRSDTGSGNSLDGGNGNDTISNYSDYSFIDGGDGNDSINNHVNTGSWGWYATVRGGKGNDTVIGNSNSADVILYASGDGNDLVQNFDALDTIRITDGAEYDTLVSGSDVIISVGSGSLRLKNANANAINIEGGVYVDADKIIDNAVGNTVISGRKGNDSVTNNGSNVTINGGAGNDFIYNGGSLSAIDGGAGNDSIYNEGSKVTIGGGTGDDYIENRESDSVSIEGGAGDDTIFNYDGDGSSINGGTGDDYVENSGSLSAIDGGAGNDYILNGGSLSAIDGGAGDDYIYNNGENATILGGDGNDIVVNQSSNSTVDGGAGNDSINNNCGSYASINGGDGKDVISNSGGNSTINGGDDDDTIGTDRGDYVSINGGNGNDYISNERGNYATLGGGAGNDSIFNMWDENVYIDGGAGADSIKNEGDLATVRGGADNDIIANSGTAVYIDGGDGADSIDNSGDHVTVNAGLGNDTITASGLGDRFIYTAGDGNDFIKNFSAADTLRIVNGKYLTVQSGSDVIVSVGSGSITLKDALGKHLNIDGVVENLRLSNAVNNTVIRGMSGHDSITNTGRNVTVEGGGGNDTITGGTGGNFYVYANGDGNDLITDFGNNDTLCITGGTYSTVVSGNDIIINVGTGSVRLKNAVGKPLNLLGTPSTEGVNLTNAANNSVVSGMNGDDTLTNSGDNVTVNGGAGFDLIRNTGNRVKIDAGNGDDLIINEGANVTVDAGLGNDTVDIRNHAGNIINYTGGNDVIVGYNPADSIKFSSAIGSTTVVGNDLVFNLENGSLRVKDGAMQKITVIDKNGNISSKYYGALNLTCTTAGVSLEGSEFGDKFICRAGKVSITAGTGNDTVDLGNEGGNLFSYVGGNDLIIGGTPTDSVKFAAAVSNTQLSGNDVVFNVGTGSLTFKDGKGKKLTVVDNKGNVSTKYYGAAIIVNDTARVSVEATEFGDTVTNRADGVSISAGGGNDLIANSGANVTVEGGNGNDTVNRADVYRYTGGNDVITDYADGDAIEIAAGAASYSVDGNDIVFNVGSGSLRVKNRNGNSIVTVNGAARSSKLFGNIRIDNSTARASVVTDLFADTVSNVGANSFINAEGGNDLIIDRSTGSTIQPGGGHDTVSLESSNAVINYTGGNDLLFGYVENDTVKFSGAIGSVSVIGNDVVFNTGGGTLTLKNASGKKITSIDGNGKATSKYYGASNINNETAGATVEATEFNDTVSNRADRVYVSAGLGNDRINDRSVGSTIAPGNGNDTVSLESSNAVINYTGGNDVLYGYVENDTVKFSSAIGSVSVIGNDVVFNTGGGSLIFKNAADRKITAVDANGKATSKYYGASAITNYVSGISIDAGNFNDTINNTADNVTIMPGGGNDLITLKGNGNVINYVGGHDTLIGFNASDSVKFANTIASSSIDGADVVFKIGNGSVRLKNGAGQKITAVESNGKITSKYYGASNISNFTSMTKIDATDFNDTVNSTADNVTIAAGGGNDLIELSGNGNLILHGGGHDTLIGFNASDSVKFANTIASSSIDGADVVFKTATGSLRLKNGAGQKITAIDANGKSTSKYYGASSITNYDSKTTVEATDFNDTIANNAEQVLLLGGGGNDIIANTKAKVTIDGGLGNDTIALGESSGNLIRHSGGNDVLYGFDNSDTLSLSNSISSYTIDGADLIFNVGTGSVRIVDANGKRLNVLSKGSFSAKIYGEANISNALSNTLITTDNFNDAITNTGNRVTIRSALGNDTIDFGNGNGNIFEYVGGHDVIVNYAETDSIKLISDSVKSFAYDGFDVVFNVTGGSLRVKDANGSKVLTLIEGNGNVISQIFSSGIIRNDKISATIKSTSKSDTIMNGAASVTINAGAGNDLIQNEGDKTSVNAGTGNDLIIDRSSQSTLAPGTGNDTVSLDGADGALIVHGGGNDLILGFDEYDTIKFASAIGGVSVSGADVVIGAGGDKLLSGATNFCLIIAHLFFFCY